MIFPKKEILFSPMLGTLGGGSMRSFGRGTGGGSTPYPFSWYTNDTAQTNRSYFSDTGWGHIGGYSGYPLHNGNVTKTGDVDNYITTQGATGNSSVKFGKMTVTQAHCEVLGKQIVEVRGCRGGNMNNQYASYSPGVVNGGKGSRLTVEVNFESLFNQHSQSGYLYIYFLSGRSGTDISLQGAGRDNPACGGGGATAMAVWAGGTIWYPIIVAAGGGGGYHNDQDTPYQRPGLNAFCPSLANITTYQQWNEYPTTGTYPGNGSLTSGMRPWSQHNYGTGSGSGSSWDYKSITYNNTSSYHAEIPSLKDHFNELLSNQYTPWNLLNPTNSDPMSNGVIVGGYGGGGGSVYGAGGGAGYFGGFAGVYGTGSSNYGRARGGQSFYDPTHCTFVSHSGSNNVFGQISVYA